MRIARFERTGVDVSLLRRALNSEVEFLFYTETVGGSIPSGPTINISRDRKAVIRQAHNLETAGANPAPATSFALLV